MFVFGFKVIVQPLLRTICKRFSAHAVSLWATLPPVEQLVVLQVAGCRMSASVYWLFFLLLLFILNVVMAASSSSRVLTRFPGLPLPLPPPSSVEAVAGGGKGAL